LTVVGIKSTIVSKNTLSQVEWDELRAALPRGSRVTGRVVSVHPFGVFVDIGLDPRIPVLLEIIHFKVIEDQPGYRINSTEDYPAVGVEMEARILAYSMKPHDIRLTQLSHLEWIHSRWLKDQRKERIAGDEDAGGGTSCPLELRFRR
jgi:ribosomal protein S1